MLIRWAMYALLLSRETIAVLAALAGTVTLKTSAIHNINRMGVGNNLLTFCESKLFTTPQPTTGDLP
jgi:hypothetical protein